MGATAAKLSQWKPVASTSSLPKLWERDLHRTICVLGPVLEASVFTVSSYVNERIKSKQLPFTSLVDSLDLFFEEQVYFGRMGSEIIRLDHRAKAFQTLGALVFLLDASLDITSAYKYAWKKAGFFSAESPANLNKINNKRQQQTVMNENEDWLSQMADGQADLLVNKPILLLLTNCDSPNALSAEQVRDGLLAKHVTGRNIRVQECAGSDVTMKGLEDGFGWLTTQVENVKKSKQWFVSKKSYPINSNLVVGKLNHCTESQQNSSNIPPQVVKPNKSTSLKVNEVLTAAAKIVL